MNRIPSAIAERLALAAALVSLAVMAVLIATSPARRVYDERWHLRYSEMIRDSGWIHTMSATTSDHSSGVGPVYPAMHLAASPATGLKAPAVRWVNYLCLLAVIAILARTFPAESRQRALVGAASILAVPFVWPTVGMALTELPALVPFSLFVLCMLRAVGVPADQPSARSYQWALAAGVFLGLAVLARQTYLAVTPALPMLLVLAPRKWGIVLTSLVVATLVCGWLFIVWGGLIPPYADYHTTTIDPKRVVLSLGYIAAATVFINPKWLWPRSLKSFLISLAVSTVVAVLIFDFTELPAEGLFARFGDLGLPMSIATRIAMTVVGFLWAWVAAQRAWEDRRDVGRVFLYLILFALVAAPAMGFSFSSRYVVAAVGVLPLVIGFPPLTDRWLPARMLLGSAAGALALLRYYKVG
jgi:hypothetical protein